MKKKFILPILTLLVISGFIIHAFITMQSVSTYISVSEIIISLLATYITFRLAPELYKNTEKDMERYTFLSITLTIFWWLLRATVIIFLIVIYFAVEDNYELAKQLLIGFVVSAGTFFTMSYIASWCIYHNGTVYPINRDPNYDDYDYEFDFQNKLKTIKEQRLNLPLFLFLTFCIKLLYINHRSVLIEGQLPWKLIGEKRFYRETTFKMRIAKEVAIPRRLKTSHTLDWVKSRKGTSVISCDKLRGVANMH